MKKQPKISVIIPTYNEERNIKKCLTSIFCQDYPKDRLEVIVVDDASTDKTLKIAKNFSVITISHKGRHGEIGKMIGFRKATGKYAIYLDADIELKGKKWFQKMIKPLEEDPKIIGAFTRKYSKKTDPPLERYYAFDPLQKDTIYQFFSPSIDEVVKEDRVGYKLLDYEKDKIPPAGRCLYRREKLLKIAFGYDMFLELDFLVLLVQKGLTLFAYVPDAGLYHHHAPDIKTLLRKRIYNVQKVYLKTLDKKLYKWFDLGKKKDLLKIFLWLVYANSIIPSIFVGIYKSIKHRDWAGMYEPVVNLLVTDTIVFAFVLSRGFSTLFK